MNTCMTGYTIQTIQTTEEMSNMCKNGHKNKNGKKNKVTKKKNKRRPKYREESYQDNRCGQCGAPKWTGQHICPTNPVECRNCRKRGHYEKMCRIPKRIQYVGKTTSSAEEDN